MGWYASTSTAWRVRQWLVEVMSTPWKPPLQMGLLVACLYAGSFQQLLWPRATDRTSPSFFQPLQVVELPWRVYL